MLSKYIYVMFKFDVFSFKRHIQNALTIVVEVKDEVHYVVFYICVTDSVITVFLKVSTNFYVFNSFLWFVTRLLPL